MQKGSKEGDKLEKITKNKIPWKMRIERKLIEKVGKTVKSIRNIVKNQVERGENTKIYSQI